MKHRTFVYLMLFLFGMSACTNSCNCNCNKVPKPQTVAIHSPIYPKGPDTRTGDPAQQVTFSLYLKNEGEPSKVELTVQKQTISSAGVISGFIPVVGPIVWDHPVNFPLTHCLFSGFENNLLVTYIFKVTYGNNETYDHTVTFATNPYPFAVHPDPEDNVPAPVYVTGDQAHSCNIVFIPDRDLTSMPLRSGDPVTWQDYYIAAVKANILNGTYGDPLTSQYRNGYNFYLNHEQGTYVTSSEVFVQPVNYLNLSFAQGKSYIHDLDYQETCSLFPGMKTFTNRIYNRGSFMHEGAHVLYNLADEYEYGKHWQDPSTPNNWLDPVQSASFAKADAAASGYGLKTENVFHLNEPSGVYRHCHILCPYEGCQMGLIGMSITPYCIPCRKAVTAWMDFYTR